MPITELRITRPSFKKKKAQDRHQDDEDKAPGMRQNAQRRVGQKRENIPRMIGELLPQSRNDSNFHRLTGWRSDACGRLFESGKKFWNSCCQRIGLKHDSRTDGNSNDNQQSDQRQIDDAESECLGPSRQRPIEELHQRP